MAQTPQEISEAAVGKGTTATLILPVATAAPETEIPAHAPAKVNRSAVILFVDEDPLIASTTEMLEDLGHRVIGANSTLHALDIIRSEQPIDLMVTDHVMPGMTGIELAAASRRLRPSLPILLATGYADLQKARNSTCRGWQNPITRTSCTTGWISCWGEGNLRPSKVLDLPRTSKGAATVTRSMRA
jgi:CheY-like chemotaxis protein